MTEFEYLDLKTCSPSPAPCVSDPSATSGYSIQRAPGRGRWPSAPRSTRHSRARRPRCCIRWHALVDGNKPLAWLAAVVFLDLNGRTVGLDDGAAFRLVMDVAEGLLDVDDIAQRLAMQ